MIQSFEEDIILSDLRENLPSSSNAPTNRENENQVPEVFEMLQRGTPVYNIINSTWKCPISLSEKIQVFDSIENQMSEIVRKEYHKWRFLQMDRNELPSFIINEYPELKKILTILYKKADGIDALEEFGQWAAQLDPILRDKIGFRAWADSQMLDLDLLPTHEEIRFRDVSIGEIPPPGYESDDDTSVESLFVQRVDWKTVNLELVDLEDNTENGACLLKIVTSASPATELFLELCSGINNYGQNGLPLGFMLIGLYASDQVGGSLEFPEDTICDLNDEVLGANPEQLTQRSQGDVLIHILRNDTNKPRHCNLIIVMTPKQFDNTHFLVGRVQDMPALLQNISTSQSNAARALQVLDCTGES